MTNEFALIALCVICVSAISTWERGWRPRLPLLFGAICEGTALIIYSTVRISLDKGFIIFTLEGAKYLVVVASVLMVVAGVSFLAAVIAFFRRE